MMKAANDERFQEKQKKLVTLSASQKNPPLGLCHPAYEIVPNLWNVS